ncbi:oncoprotein-induced transcript 3 protein-like isoform X1 [Saccostrea cucullata]|uniref:oncoprotein-induced transcript 3 protein-like isoform X1 n=1 Tax=Saccostrea cuccullata TaxID=36930 RepID=UPI002ED2817D
MKMKFSILSIFSVFILNSEINVESTYYCGGVTDPCTAAGELFEPYARTRNCPYDGTKPHVPCDRYKTPGWYRSDEPILDECPALGSCGTVYPVWFNGTLPEVADGVVSRKLCKTGFSSCCVKEYNVQIKNCTTHHVYCLPALDACPERFCFGKHGPCEYPTTTAVQTTQTTTEQGKRYKDLERRYTMVIVIVVILVCCLIGLGSTITFIFVRKKMRDREISQSRVELVPEEYRHDTVQGVTGESNGVPPHLHFQVR